MKNRILLPTGGQVYKANLHAHTILSDGKWSKEQLKDEYKKRGYSVVAYTDHRHYSWHKELADADFLPLAAFEADLNEFFEAPTDFSRIKTFHINFYDTSPNKHTAFKAIQPPQCYGDIQSLNAFIRQMNELGFIACYNHPWWSLQNYDDYKDLRGLFAMEIYNHGCEHDGLYGYAPQAYDDILRTGTRLFCLATDDNHNSFPPDSPLSDSFGGFTMIYAPSLTYESIITALQKGDFYASTGPELQELAIENDVLHVKCSPVQKIYVATEGRRCYHSVASEGDTITEAYFPLHGDEGYLRVDCESAQRKHAYSNAYFLDKL